MEGQIVEIHTHVVARNGDNTGFYCTYVYLDGTQCRDTWQHYPHIQAYQGSRVFKRDDVTAWVKAGGQV